MAAATWNKSQLHLQLRLILLIVTALVCLFVNDTFPLFASFDTFPLLTPFPYLTDTFPLKNPCRLSAFTVLDAFSGE